jgi:hypothetical protein
MHRDASLKGLHNYTYRFNEVLQQIGLQNKLKRTKLKHNNLMECRRFLSAVRLCSFVRICRRTDKLIYAPTLHMQVLNVIPIK